VILAAHSYGGVPATWAAAETRVAHLVYLAAFALKPGVSMMQWMGGEFRRAGTAPPTAWR
jgi:pimeloyl-ACP methyl ester carboxylesterase